jgi:hypothetical protein
MSDIIRALNQCRSEQEQIQNQRVMARLTRAGRQPEPPTPKLYTPPSPQFPAGIVPVFVINPPRRIR